MICVGGPAAGKYVKSDIPFREFNIPVWGSASARVCDFANQLNPAEFTMNIARYRVERITFIWHEAGEFSCVALVHEDMKDKAQVRRAVLSAFVSSLLESMTK